eukprot:366381-Chlamydomonas_euryale.AAC.11
MLASMNWLESLAELDTPSADCHTATSSTTSSTTVTSSGASHTRGVSNDPLKNTCCIRCGQGGGRRAGLAAATVCSTRRAAEILSAAAVRVQCTTKFSGACNQPPSRAL